MQWSAAELFEGRHCSVLEQFAAPAAADHELVEGERALFPGWTHDRLPLVPEWDERSATEWERADVIWVPSSHLIPLCERFGARPEKFSVVRYPVPAADAPVIRHFDGARPLRVAFAGSLILRKGVQYIYEALKGWNSGDIEMHFLGPLELTELAGRRLSEVGQLHGHLARESLLARLRESDVLLFPSLSEGSALVLGEALSTGLPVIATPESAPPESAWIIPPRDPEAIRAALRRLLDQPGLVEDMSRAAVDEARTRSPRHFFGELATLARSALTPSASATRIG
jgi:glycosyltransferase involved in cell wall biosynthesis